MRCKSFFCVGQKKPLVKKGRFSYSPWDTLTVFLLRQTLMNPSSDETHVQQNPNSVHEEATEKVEREEDAPKWSAVFQDFMQKLGALQTPEEKIALGLQFMRGSVSQEGSPRFREFWESRRLVLPLFRENVNAAVRSKLWDEYIELTVEARRLKEILEEQSVFAMEQIDLAIQAIEQDLTNFETLLGASSDIDFSQAPYIIQDKQSVYNQMQKELNLLNTQASRLNGLRKEIMKTDMRIRFKTKFFKRLSELGEKIFPKRKELIEKVSQEFQKDVDHFVSEHFKEEGVVGAPYYALREEIKAFQWVAKVLTLSSSIFSRTRVQMSACWDQVKVLEKEHKKVILEKKQASSGVRQHLQSKIEELRTNAETMTLQALDHEIDEIVNEMHAIYLDRDDLRTLRDALSSVRAPHIHAQEKKARDLEEAEKEKIRQKKEKLAHVKNTIAEISQKAAHMELDLFVAEFKQLETDIGALEIAKIEKQQLERQLRPLKDLIAEKKEQSLINLSDDDRKTLENLRQILQQKKERRQEIKETMDAYRKTLGASNLDFEKAFHIRELLDQEKERLDKANLSIEEIEDKISELEG